MPVRDRSESTLRRKAGALLCGVVGLAIVAAPAHAAPDDEAIAADEPAAPAAVAGAHVDIMANLNNWVFGGHGVVMNPEDHFLGLQVELQIDELERLCKLTVAQREKLKRAATIDTRRFLADLEAMRQRCAELDQNDPQVLNQIWPQIQPLRDRFASGLYNEGSFFAKVRRQTLTPEQAASYRAEVIERRELRRRADVAMTLMMVEEKVPLTDAQHAKLAEILLETGREIRTTHQLKTWMLMIQLSKLPEERVKPLFDERQWRLFLKLTAQYRNVVLPVDPRARMREEEDDVD